MIFVSMVSRWGSVENRNVLVSMATAVRVEDRNDVSIQTTLLECIPSVQASLSQVDRQLLHYVVVSYNLAAHMPYIE